MHKRVCVITGGGSGIGLETAKILGRDYKIIIAGRSLDKLKTAQSTLAHEGVDAEYAVCDVADRASVEHLASTAHEFGEIAALINSAGLSAAMGDARTIMEVNAIGTVNVNEVFGEVLLGGSCIVNVASMAAYIVPKIVLPIGGYRYSRIDAKLFMKRMMSRVNLFPKSLRPDMAYCISKHFVIWYAKTEAARLGQKGIRVISISPGMFETPMAEVEREKASKYIQYTAFKRSGEPGEIAHLIAFCAGDKPGYLTGTDILCDGGCVASGFNPLKNRTPSL
jgi:NAD(P)-dependent dehydrogenase (short-subunit alcohol dehydrogenase family)